MLAGVGCDVNLPSVIPPHATWSAHRPRLRWLHWTRSGISITKVNTEWSLIGATVPYVWSSGINRAVARLPDSSSGQITDHIPTWAISGRLVNKKNNQRGSNVDPDVARQQRTHEE